MELFPAQGERVNTACGPSGVALHFLQRPCISAVFQHAVAMHRPMCLIEAHSHIGILNIPLGMHLWAAARVLDLEDLENGSPDVSLGLKDLHSAHLYAHMYAHTQWVA